MSAVFPYEDILYLPHHVSDTRPQMPMSDRAAQFSPFAALTGYDEVIRETARLTDREIIPGEDALQLLNEKLTLLAEAEPAPEASITYFVPDSLKKGGTYRTASGRIDHVDRTRRLLFLRDGSSIPMDRILDIDSDLFNRR